MSGPTGQPNPGPDPAKLAWVRNTPGSSNTTAQTASPGVSGQADSKQADAKKVFTAEWESAKAELLKVLELKPEDPVLLQLHKQMTAVDERMKVKVRRGDFMVATKDLDELIALLDKFRNYELAKSDAKTAFAAKWNGVKNDVLKALESEPQDPKLQKMYKEMMGIDEQMKASLRKEDYARAGKELDHLLSLVAGYRNAAGELAVQADAKAAFTAKWNAVKDPLLKTLGTPPDEPELQKIYQQMTPIDSQMKALLHQNDFPDALKSLDQLIALLADFQKAEKNSPKGRYEAALAKIRLPLDEALSRDWKSKEMTELQDGVSKKKSEMEAAAAKKDYSQAMKLLEALNQLVHEFLEETRKTSRGCDWIRDTAALLHATIHRKYLEAASKLDTAAQAYDDALKDFRETIDSEHDFVADFLVELFFIGLAGAAGGAVGVKFKGMLDKAVDGAKKSGAMLDATKDIVKFLTRSSKKLGQSSDDPLKGLGGLEGNGVDLGRKVGVRLKDEAARLLLGVEGLLKLVRDADCKTEEFRIEGDPVKTLDNDPFLAILGTISPEKTSYGRLIWKEWADHLGSTNILTISFRKKIRDQTGGDADVEKALDEREEAHGKMVEKNWQKTGRGA